MKSLVVCILSIFPLTVFANCELTTPNLYFGMYDSFDQQSNISTSIISVKCDGNINYELRISSGQSNQFNDRYLIGSKGDKLYYNLYNDVSMNTIFGDGTSGTQTYKGNSDKVAIYGKIPAKQQVLPGQYSDSLLISLYF